MTPLKCKMYKSMFNVSICMRKSIRMKRLKAGAKFGKCCVLHMLIYFPQFLQQDISAHQRQFDELQNMVTQMQGADTRLVNYSSQLNSRYETLKANTRDLVNRWQDYVRDHQSYQSNYSQCVEWVQTLKKRQEVI